MKFTATKSYSLDHPVKGILSPDYFISVAEKNGDDQSDWQKMCFSLPAGSGLLDGSASDLC